MPPAILTVGELSAAVQLFGLPRVETLSHRREVRPLDTGKCFNSKTHYSALYTIVYYIPALVSLSSPYFIQFTELVGSILLDRKSVV